MACLQTWKPQCNVHQSEKNSDIVFFMTDRSIVAHPLPTCNTCVSIRGVTNPDPHTVAFGRFFSLAYSDYSPPLAWWVTRRGAWAVVSRRGWRTTTTGCGVRPARRAGRSRCTRTGDTTAGRIATSSPRASSGSTPRRCSPTRTPTRAPSPRGRRSRPRSRRARSGSRSRSRGARWWTSRRRRRRPRTSPSSRGGRR